ncbi:MAG TPA: YceI family protein [Dehalococcoidia bacterium]|nr:YceI family protein [Dehalococcoidia bacterium]
MGWQVDKSHTEVGFAVRHMMLATVRGRMALAEADIQLDEANPAGSWARAKIDVQSIDTREPQRDAHLRSPDFFDAENHPYIEFASTSVRVKRPGEFEVTGDLTIRGVTRPLTLKGEFEGPLKDAWGKTRAGFHLEGELDREAFGLTWNAMLETGGVVVGKTVKLSIDTEVVQEVAAEAPAALAS